MQDIERYIRDDVESDPSIDSRGLVIEVNKKGLFKKRSRLCISGAVGNESSKKKILSIAEKQAGDNYDIVDTLTVKAKG